MQATAYIPVLSLIYVPRISKAHDIAHELKLSEWMNGLEGHGQDSKLIRVEDLILNSSEKYLPGSQA